LMKKKILVSRKYPEAGISLLREQGFDLTLWEKDRPMTPQELAELAKGCQALGPADQRSIIKGIVREQP